MKWEKEYKSSKDMQVFITTAGKLGLKKDSAKRTYYKLQSVLGNTTMTTANGRKVLAKVRRTQKTNKRQSCSRPNSKPKRASRTLPSKILVTFYKTCNGTQTGKILKISVQEMRTMLDMAKSANTLAIGVDIVEEE